MRAAVPPLVALMEGRARPRKAPVVHPREIVLHVAVAKLLRDHARPEWRWSHFPAGEARDLRTGARLKAMGLKRGWPDFLLIAPNGLTHCLELKRLGESLSDDQREFEAWCAASGVPHVVAYTLDDVLSALGGWGALKVNIAFAGFERKGSRRV
jgi:hypothetical protein